MHASILNIARGTEAEQIYKSIAEAADAFAYFVDFLNRCLSVMPTFFQVQSRTKKWISSPSHFFIVFHRLIVKCRLVA